MSFYQSSPTGTKLDLVELSAKVHNLQLLSDGSMVRILQLF